MEVDMDIVKLLNYMENLRYDRKMTQDFYLDGIISQRQYYRYRSGESEVPFDVIVKFANKLEIPLLKLISTFQTETEKEKEIVSELYNLILDRRLSEASQLMKKHKKMMLLDEETQKFYYLAMILFKRYSNKISNEEMINQLKTEVGFDNIMKKEVLHDTEIYLLGMIMQYSDKDREIVFNKIELLRKKNKLLLGGNVLLNLQLYFWILKSLGRLNRYDELLEIADDAIDYSQKNYSYYSVEHFHYFKALAYFKKGMNTSFEEELLKTIFILVQRDEHKRNRFFDIIKKDTDVVCKDFVLKKIEREW